MNFGELPLPRTLVNKEKRRRARAMKNAGSSSRLKYAKNVPFGGCDRLLSLIHCILVHEPEGLQRGPCTTEGAYGMWRVFLLLTMMSVALAMASGVALAATIDCTGGYCAGTKENDVMNGTDTYDLMYGLGGDDNMFGHFGNDEMYGGEGADFLLGDEDYDYPDTLLGNDTLYGGPGNDDLRGAFGNDKIYGGGGDDFVFAYDQLNVTAGADVVDCGPGVDTVHYDKGVDKIRHCEIKVRTTQN